METIKPMNNQPTPNQIYRHRKHDPAAGKWHEYKVVAIVSPPERESMLATTNFPMGECTHTETQQRHTLIGCRGKVYADPVVDVDHVAYRSTKGGETVWLRPMDMFMDGRFELVDASQAGEP